MGVKRYISRIVSEGDVFGWTEDPKDALLCIPSSHAKGTDLGHLSLLVKSTLSNQLNLAQRSTEFWSSWE